MTQGDGKTAALIFDMDGTMVDSMPWHARSWVEFARRHAIQIDVTELMRRTTGRTGIECIREVFQRDLDREEALTKMNFLESLDA